MSEKHEVRIHINQKPYHSPNPTDGEALYALGDIKPGLELYREVAGNREDKPIPRSKEHIHLKEDEHFHSGEQHQFTIIVNLQKKTVTTKEVSFEQVVKLAFDPVPQNSIFTVTFFGAAHDHEGILKAGQKVEIKERTVFNVTETGQS